MSKTREASRYERQAKERIHILVNDYCGGRQQDLADKSGVGKSSISQYMHGRSVPSNLAAEKLCRPFGLNPAWLMGFDVPRTWSAQELLNERSMTPSLVPLLGRISAGPENWVYDDVYDWVPYKSGIDKEEYYALIISGESMSPTLLDGDMVYVHATAQVHSGDIAVVVINGYEGTCKEVKFQDDGLLLIGHNQSVYTPHFYSAEQIQSLPIQIKGKVVDMRRSFE